MMSIDNTYEEGGLRDFDDRVRRLLGTSDFCYTCEPKIDGVSLSLRYETGMLVTAATRGDGVHGDDVTNNARTIRNIPMRLREQNAGKKNKPDLFAASGDEKQIVEVRGEVFISQQVQFAKINAALQEEMGEEAYANPPLYRRWHAQATRSGKSSPRANSNSSLTAPVNSSAFPSTPICNGRKCWPRSAFAPTTISSRLRHD